MPPRLKEIAEELGLSVTTVSRALAGYPDVAAKTRQRVRATAKRMGYVPNVAGQRLRGSATRTIGLILPTFGPRFSDPFFSELIAGVGNETGRQGYDLLLSTVAPGNGEVDIYRRQIYSHRVDGMLVVRTREQDPRIRFLIETDFPFVAFGMSNQTLDFPWVDVDGRLGTRAGVEHLIQLRHRRIAYLGGPEDLMFSTLRLQGFREALEAHGIAANEAWILRGDLTQRSGHELTNQLLQDAERPTALVAANDLMALGAMAAAQTQGLRIGEDLSVVGFDDIPPAESAHPPLTTIHQPIYRIATTITARLIKTLQGEPLVERHDLLIPKLIVRESTGPAA